MDTETGLEHDANGHLKIGPRLFSYSNALSRLIASALGGLTDEETVREAAMLTIARAAVTACNGNVEAAWGHVRATTTKRQRTALRLRREDLYEARGWLAARAA